MATRKSRLNTESPTPSGTESVPTTPTTPATRNTRSIRNKQLQLGKTEETTIQIKSEKLDEEDEAVKDTNNDEEINEATTTTTTATATSTAVRAMTPTVTNEKIETKENIEQNEKEKESSPPAASTRKRRIAAAKEENVTTEKQTTTNGSVSPNTIDDGKTSPNKTKRSRRSAFEVSANKEDDTSTIMKRRNSTGKIEKPTRKLSSRIKKLKQLRKTTMGRAMLKKPEKIAVVVNKPIKQLIEKQATKGTKIEKNDSASDSEIIKMSRRRSDSVSKCSDITDASSFHETKGSVEDLLTQSSETSDGKVVIKEEMPEKDESLENKAPEIGIVEPARISANDSGIGGDSDNSQVAKTDGDQSNDGKRSSRFPRRKRPLNLPRVMNTRSRSETPSKAASENQYEEEEEVVSTKEIKKEAIESLIESPLHIDTTVAETNANEKRSPDIEQSDKEMLVAEKAKSLSPVLVSEGVSEISVKQFYGRADFLENNLGIEKDPKLGEIVQIQEKMKAESKENGDKSEEISKKSDQDCAKAEKITNITESSGSNVVHVIDTSTESMEIDENDDQIDGAKCDEKNAKDPVDCFVKPAEIIRRDSATLLNENLLVLNGEIELTSKKEKKEMVKMEEGVSEVVLYKISNGMRMNPEKLEKVLESQKLREKERSSSVESVEEREIVENEKTKPVDEPTKMVNDVKDKAVKNKTKPEESVSQSNSTDISVNADSDKRKDILIRPAAVRSSSNSKDSRSSSLDDESPEERIQKESHLKTLGLLTHQAAEEASIEKQKQREKFKVSKGKKNSEYTGTLKTVIKLHRGNNDKKKGKQSLKMTLHKGRAKNGSDKSDSHSNANSEEDTYYTIHQQDVDIIGEKLFMTFSLKFLSELITFFYIRSRSR